MGIFCLDQAEVDTDDEEDEDAYRDYADDALDPNEAEEAGQTAADIEARMRQRDRLGIALQVTTSVAHS